MIKFDNNLNILFYNEDLKDETMIGVLSREEEDEDFLLDLYHEILYKYLTAKDLRDIADKLDELNKTK